MTRAADKVTRFDAELVESAAAEGVRQQRTGRQQLEHWARVGRALTAHETVARSRVEAALAGKLDPDTLNEAEGQVFNAEIRAAIAEDLAAADYQSALAQQGITTVWLDDQGRMVEHSPDGSTRILDGE